MRRWLKIAGGLVLALVLLLIVYAGKGYADALSDAPGLKRRAAALVAVERGPADLGLRKLDQLLRIEDPGFWQHGGVDVASKGAGLTTLTQSLAKRLAFSTFKPGLRKIRQSTYAIGLERRLTKAEILTLWLDSAQVGRGPSGWMTGMFAASQQVYGRAPADLSDRQWLRLVAVLVAPGRFRLMQADPQLDTRVGRIERLLAGRCTPSGERDVWLKGCA